MRKHTKIGGLSPLFGEGELGCHPTQSIAWAKAYLHTKWHLNPYSHLVITDVGRKLGAVLLWVGGAGSPSNTMWPGPRPIRMPSFILIHPTVWPQYTNVTDIQTGQATV